MAMLELGPVADRRGRNVELLAYLLEPDVREAERAGQVSHGHGPDLLVELVPAEFEW
jgi:hypothetical protein